jgi:3-isopropylmalate dehydrogenase
VNSFLEKGHSAMASTTYKICLLPGDGIGPEIIAEAVKLLAAVGEAYDVDFACEEHLIGGCAIDATRAAGAKATALPDETLAAAQASDAVLLAAVGGYKWDNAAPGEPRPEQGLLAIRKALGLYLNLRPVRIYESLRDASSLKPELLEGVDILIVRELTGGIYFGAHERTCDVEGAGGDGKPGTFCRDMMDYSEYEIERVVRWAFDAASRRPRAKVTSVDKANVLETSRLWREVAHRVAAEYPQVAAEDMLVDNCAMQLVARPAQFDVLVTENTFGDILSDEASMLTGSLGMLASASLGSGTALYEPSHGSAPDIAGKGIANPIAQILSVELMLRYSFGMDEAADRVAKAVKDVLNDGWRTGDIADAQTPADKRLGTVAMGDKIVEYFKRG